MPPGEKLAPAELSALRDWLKGGAAWPAGVVIATGGAGSGGADNLALARRIYARVTTQNPGVTPPKPYKKVIPGTDISYEMTPIPAGEFRMGTPGKKDETPVHPVRIEAFWMSVHEV